MELDDQGVIVSCSSCGQQNRLRYERLGNETRCGKCKESITLPRSPLEISSDQVFSAIISKSSLPICIDFWAPWCGPCKMVAPEVEKVAAKADSRFLVAKLNTDEVPSVAGSLQ